MTMNDSREFPQRGCPYCTRDVDAAEGRRATGSGGVAVDPPGPHFYHQLHPPVVTDRPVAPAAIRSRVDATEPRMSTDQQQKPAETKPAETKPAQAGPSPVAERLSSVWHDLKGGKLISYRVMAITLVVLTGLGLWLYLASSGRTADSAKWTALDRAGSIKDLEDFAKNNPDTPAGRVARLQLARYKLGPLGIDSLKTPGARQQAIA